MNIHNVYGALSRRFRTRRMGDFVGAFGVTESTRILDAGGSLFNWELVDVRPRLTIVNLEDPPPDLPAHVDWMVGDARAMPFDDGSFDICFSNSVIEHMYTWEGQQQFASEVRRVARGYYVQTPNRWFPVEPHYLTPFVHWVPDGTRPRLLRYFTVWGWMTSPTPEQCHAMVEEIRLMTRGEMAELFPDAEVGAERVLGLTKSLIATRLPT